MGNAKPRSEELEEKLQCATHSKVCSAPKKGIRGADLVSRVTVSQLTGHSSQTLHKAACTTSNYVKIKLLVKQPGLVISYLFQYFSCSCLKTDSQNLHKKLPCPLSVTFSVQHIELGKLLMPLQFERWENFRIKSSFVPKDLESQFRSPQRGAILLRSSSSTLRVINCITLENRCQARTASCWAEHYSKP